MAITARLMAATLASSFLLVSAVACAQDPGKLPRIGILWPGDVDPYNRAFLEGLRQEGFVHGATAMIDIRSTGPDMESGFRLAEELVALSPSVVFSAPAPLAKHVVHAAEKAGKNVPLVVLAYDPVAEGLVASAARPSGSVTGVGLAQDPQLVTKLLQVLKEMVPKVSRVVYLEDPTWGPTKSFSIKAREALQRAGRSLGVSITTVEIRASDDIDRAFARAVRQRADAVLSTASPIVLTHRAQIIALAARHRLPAIYGDELLAQDGGLMSYWASIADTHVRAAKLAAKILRGAKPGQAQ